ncbi:MAG TPA: sigma 54-interacting transcriptional regulator [Candidatus Limnocylindrales bacterium]|nr:sigma 54-interacting transcriptional regulator [Candidatus Limnocylindrales bacterium]
MDYVFVYKGDNLNKAENVISIDPRKPISIGRHDFNDIHLPDPSVSRFHVIFFPNPEGHYYFQDLGSQNGTYINGKKRDYGIVNEEDRIGVGNYTVIFQKQGKKSRVEKSYLTIMADENENDLMKTVHFYALSPERQEEVEMLKGDPEGLLLLYRLSRFANLTLDMEEALQGIVEELAKFLHPGADHDPSLRIFIVLLEPGGANLTCLAKFPSEEGEIKVSQTIIRRLLDERKALMVMDASVDERFKTNGVLPAGSILGLQIKSVICIPLEWDKEIQGFLYLSSSQKGLFGERDLNLLNLISADISALIEKDLDYRAIRDEKARLENKLEMEGTIIGVSPGIRNILKTIEKLADTDVNVLITGETGTGKDLVAKAIHQSSKRRGKPFIDVNCAAIPETLLESELFGVIANYPGLHNKEALKGKFELAHGGVVFLNEIGELPPKLQAKLLTVLEEKKIWPLGGTHPIPVDIRILAATNRNLQQEVREGRFREDLYERLNTFPLHLPPLRERKEDIPLLAGYFLYKLRQQYAKRISRFSNSCMKSLTLYDWPRNIRELKNAIERAIILTDKSVITPEFFDFKVKKETKPKSLREVEKEHILRVLEYTQGNKEKAGHILGISKQTLYNKGKEYGLPGFEESV